MVCVWRPSVLEFCYVYSLSLPSIPPSIPPAHRYAHISTHTHTHTQAERKERRRKIMEENQATTAMFKKHLDKQKRSVMGVSESGASESVSGWVNK